MRLVLKGAQNNPSHSIGLGRIGQVVQNFVMHPFLPAMLCLIALVAPEEKPNLPVVDLSGQKDRQVVVAAGTPSLIMAIRRPC
jgi:hypothetical protein